MMFSLLFQIGSRSSFYSQVNVLRQKGSYIYEEFMPTDGTDVKASLKYRIQNKCKSNA